MKQDEPLAQDIVGSMQGILKTEFLTESYILDLLPAAVYVCDAKGYITNFNKRAVELWGKTPAKSDTEEHFYNHYKLYYPDGTLMRYHEAPVAASLADGQPRKDVEMIIERPDHTQAIVNVNVVPVLNEHGKVKGVINCFHDITGQKRTQKELDWKTRELQDYVDNAAIGLHWVDANGIIKWANKAELQMLGYTEEEYIGHHISEFHIEQDKINDILNRLGCNETLNNYEATLRCKDGSARTVHISSNVFFDEGKFVHTRCFTIDVTEQKELFKSLKESELRYRQLVQNLQTPLYTTDVEGRITLYNKAAADLWGREPKIGQDMWCGSYKAFDTDGAELPLEQYPMAICLKEKRPVYGREILVMRADGSFRNVAPYPQPIFDDAGNMIGAINMLVDITELKLAEKALRDSEAKYKELAASRDEKVKEQTLSLIKTNEELKKSEERYHKMIEEVEDYAIILLDKEGIIQNWNKGAEKIKGYKEQEIVGNSFQNFYLPDDRESGLPLRLLEHARKNGKATHEGWRMRKDGTAFWGSVVLTALHSEQGDVIGFSKVTRDLTERKIAEDRLKEYTSQLEFQNKELEQFAYAASHDMKEPLRKIHFFNSAVFESQANKLDERSREYLNRSINAVKRMNDLIEDLLKYSKTTASVEAFEDVDVREVVEEIVQLHEEEMEQKKVMFEIGQLPVIQAIAFQIKQLMTNLINNSIKYRVLERDTVIRITSELKPGAEIQHRDVLPEKQYYVISVEDNGMGFKQQHGEKIFEIFQRLNNNTGTRGSGIGLAICKKIVQNHHGFIKATGKENEGARFDVYLPIM